MQNEGKNHVFLRLFLKRQKLPDYVRNGPEVIGFKGKRNKGLRKKRTYDEYVRKVRKRTRLARDEAVVRHRAQSLAHGSRTKRELSEVIASLSNEERLALAGNEHAISAVEKIIEAMLFRFSQ